MSHPGVVSAKSIGRRGALLLAAFATALAMPCASFATQAHAEGKFAEYFCYYKAAPYGLSGDRCYASTGHHLVGVHAYGYEHSACSDAWKEEKLVTSWVCAPTATWSNSYFDGTRDILAVIRNNVTCCTNQLWGLQEWN